MRFQTHIFRLLAGVASNDPFDFAVFVRYVTRLNLLETELVNVSFLFSEGSNIGERLTPAAVANMDNARAMN